MDEGDAYVCEWCDQSFTRPSAMGPPPKFCSASHRQRAYEVRRLEGIEAERDRLREVLAGIVFYLGPVSSPRSGRDPADGDGVIAYSYVPALVAAAVVERDRLRGVVDAAKLATGRLTRRAEGAEAERDRLWAVVDAVRVMWDNIVGTADDAVMGFPATDYLAIEEALDQLDGSTEATDG